MTISLRIEIIGIEPLIWRNVIVPSDIALDELHSVIQGAMAWQDYHLHEFNIMNQTYGIPESDEFGSEEASLDERNVLLKPLVNNGDEFIYIYDFGDNWRHKIVVENIQNDKSDPYNPVIPLCVGGERATPPEDCGGIYNYPNFVTSLKDRNHPEHKQNMKWSNAFQPEIFSISQATALIACLYVRCFEKKGKQLV